MTPEEFFAFRQRLGWSRKTLGRELGMHPSRLADFESGYTRGKLKKPVPIPRVVELACERIEQREATKRPAADKDWLVLLRRLAQPREGGAPLDLTREGIYRGRGGA